MSRPTSDQVADQYSVKDAARHLGISENAVMQRIKRGTLTARKHDGRWLVTIVTDTDQEATGRSGYHQPAGDRSTDQEATDPSPTMLALSYQALAPIMERMETIARENGRLIERVTTAEQTIIAREQTIDELRAEVELLREIRERPIETPMMDNNPHDGHETIVSEPLENPSNAPGREQGSEGPKSHEHRESWLATGWRRLFGRS